MTEIRFYHLTRKSVDQALPELIERALSRGHKILVRAADDNVRDRLNDHLWTWKPDSFIPHGGGNDPHPEKQPVWLTASLDNPNAADVVMLTPGCESGGIGDFTLCCDLFDGQDETQVENARNRWKSAKDSGHSATYWQQDDAGKWVQKA